MATIHTLRQPRARRTHRQLLAAARRVFARRGYREATIEEVAEAAGCSKGAFYFHFPSKEAALLALLDAWAVEREEALSQAARAGRPAKETLDATFEALLEPGRDGWDVRLVLEFWSEAERSPAVARRLARARRAWRRRLVATFADARTRGALPRDMTPEAAANAVLTLHHGLIVEACLQPSGGPPARERAEAALALLAS